MLPALHRGAGGSRYGDSARPRRQTPDLIAVCSRVVRGKLWETRGHVCDWGARRQGDAHGVGARAARLAARRPWPARVGGGGRSTRCVSLIARGRDEAGREKKHTVYYYFEMSHALLKIKTLYLNISVASYQFGGSKEALPKTSMLKSIYKNTLHKVLSRIFKNKYSKYFHPISQI